MESPEQLKQVFLHFMESKQQPTTFSSPWNPPGEASDGSFTFTMHGHTHPCSQSSNQCGPLLKEHDYIGLAEVNSSACSSVNECDGTYAFEDTDLRLCLGPLKAGVNASSKKSILELDLLDPKNRIPQSYGFASSAVVSPSKNGFKRAYGQALGEASAGLNMSSLTSSVLQAEEKQHMYTSGWPAITSSNGFYPNTSDDSTLDHLQDFEAAHPAEGQVVGWPPIRSYRKNTIAMARILSSTDVGGQMTIYVKVNMDGIPIGRKVDLSAYHSYESLMASLEEMFYSPNSGNGLHFLSTSEFVLTYEDKDGDWMLVGDVPWGMFVNSVRRLHIVRRSETTGLGPKTLH